MFTQAVDNSGSKTNNQINNGLSTPEASNCSGLECLSPEQVLSVSSGLSSSSLSSFEESPCKTIPAPNPHDNHDRNLYDLLVEWGFPEYYNRIWFGKIMRWV